MSVDMQKIIDHMNKGELFEAINYVSVELDGLVDKSPTNEQEITSENLQSIVDGKQVGGEDTSGVDWSDLKLTTGLPEHPTITTSTDQCQCDECNCEKKEEKPVARKYTYIGDRSQNTKHAGIITIASEIDDEEGVIFYTVSYCSPKDEFQKSIGRDICNDRFDNDDFDVVPFGKKTANELTTRIMAHMYAYSEENPSWARKVILEELIYQGMGVLNNG